MSMRTFLRSDQAATPLLSHGLQAGVRECATALAVTRVDGI